MGLRTARVRVMAVVLVNKEDVLSLICICVEM